jgi:hypothetical protein
MTDNNAEKLGPADRIIQSVLAYTDHMIHNRPGVVMLSSQHDVGVSWSPVTHRMVGNDKIVFQLSKAGKKTVEKRLGVLQPNLEINEHGRIIGCYQPAGKIFPEVAVWMYRRVAEVFELDNEFAARWASYAFTQDHRDLKVVLAAFMLVQTRKGDPVMEEDKILFHDEDYRDVGEAMSLLGYDVAGGNADQRKALDLFRKSAMNPKMLLRIHELLTVPQIAAVNHELGFGNSARKPFLGRWPKTVEKWLKFRENNPKILEGLVKAGYKNTVRELARRVGYKPDSQLFFEKLAWKQNQSKDGRRSIAIDQEMKSKIESWFGLTEQQICERIIKDRPGYKRIIGLLPKSVGLTRAIMAASIEAGCLSDKDLIILTPTLEAFGLLADRDVKRKFEKALESANDMRASNVLKNVRSKEVRSQLQNAAETATKKAVEDVVRNMRIYFIVDISGSMENSIAQAMIYVEKFLPAFPLDRLHVSVFNNTGKELFIKHASAAGVKQAFTGIRATGATFYEKGVLALQQHKPAANEDSLLIFIGDERNHDCNDISFEVAVEASGLRPMAFGLIRVGQHLGISVQSTARKLDIPCFMIDNLTFEDPYALPRLIRNLVSATPVGAGIPERTTTRTNLIDAIMATPILLKPTWAA